MKNRKKIYELQIEVLGMRELWLLAVHFGWNDQADNINSMIVQTQQLIRELKRNGEPSEPQ